MPVDAADGRPRLVVFFSSRSGQCRRTDAQLARVLQRRRNHATFAIVRVDVDKRPDLAERFAVEALPTYVVIDGKRVRGRLQQPASSRDIQAFLAPWLRSTISSHA
jgi:thioredoxin-like negative regulator of GroEL